jgi:hypothetical protein
MQYHIENIHKSFTQEVVTKPNFSGGLSNIEVCSIVLRLLILGWLFAHKLLKKICEGCICKPSNLHFLVKLS